MLHHNSTPSHTSFFTRELLTKNNTTVVYHPPYSPDLASYDFVSHHFDTAEVIKEESQAVLNTLKVTTSRMHLKNGRNFGNGLYARKRTTLRVMVASKRKVSS
jgi:hypothetical protein